MDIVNSCTLPSLLPHDGAMILLDCVRCWDRERISCASSSHRRQNNPLRHAGRLPIEAGIEYAAQAMAIHGNLCAGEPGRKPRLGYVAVLSRVRWSVQHLDDIDEELVVRAEKLAASTEGARYRFAIFAADRELIAGEATVAFA